MLFALFALFALFVLFGLFGLFVQSFSVTRTVVLPCDRFPVLNVIKVQDCGYLCRLYPRAVLRFTHTD